VLTFIVVVGMYMFAILDVYRAYVLAHRDNLSDLKRAVQIAPWIADHNRLLGKYYSSGGDFAAAAESYRAAISLNADLARYWLDLAAVDEFIGRLDEQENALEEANRVDPTAPVVAAEIANLYLVRGDVDKALQHFRLVLEYESDPDIIAAALDRCWHATSDVTLILRNAMPAKVAAHLMLLQLVTKLSQPRAASEVWSHLVDLRQPFRPELAFPYFQDLILTRQVAQACKVWQDLASLSSAVAYRSKGNLVVNSSFEQQVLNGGFDWRIEKTDDPSIWLDSDEAYSGHSSLTIQFSGAPVENIGAQELIPLQSNTHYQLSGYVKTDDLESGSGPRVAIKDTYAQKYYLVTDEFFGSAAWQRFSGEFSTSADTSLVTLEVVREPGDLPIRGRMWIDDLTLTETRSSGDPDVCSGH
jgi:tetratricopeptide (TPR) repeat protein